MDFAVALQTPPFSREFPDVTEFLQTQMQNAMSSSRGATQKSPYFIGFWR
jgi:hypothetical protein